jgi:hypothetical protein
MWVNRRKTVERSIRLHDVDDAPTARMRQRHVSDGVSCFFLVERGGKPLHHLHQMPSAVRFGRRRTRKILLLERTEQQPFRDGARVDASTGCRLVLGETHRAGRVGTPVVMP